MPIEFRTDSSLMALCHWQVDQRSGAERNADRGQSHGLEIDTVDGADQAFGTLKVHVAQRLVSISNGAIVRWETGKKKPKSEQLSHVTPAGAVGGAFWGMLFGLLFYVPFLGMAIGAALGALTAMFADYGIDGNFIEHSHFIESDQGAVGPGASALFLLGGVTARERIVDALKFAGLRPELIACNLSKDQEASLRADFGEEL